VSDKGLALDRAGHLAGYRSLEMAEMTTSERSTSEHDWHSRPQMERDGKLIFTETKGRARVVKHHALPIVAPLRASIDATPTGHLVYLVTLKGAPHSAKAFGGWFRVCTRLGILGGPDL